MANLKVNSMAVWFTFDGNMVYSPINYAVISLLLSSVRHRLMTGQINVLTKFHLVTQYIKEILDWSSSTSAIEAALGKEKDVEFSLLSKHLVKRISKRGIAQSLIVVSSLPKSGFVNVTTILARIFSQGEEIRGLAND